MIKVSVIVPIYNGEKYLEECLDSICNQTLTEIEIICVDDGSTDKSYEILEEYKRNDNRIKLFRQCNLFAGAARNLGKANARGEYLVFWDCDDFFELTALEKMYHRITETDADICVCGGKRYYQNAEKLYPWPGYMNKKRVPAEVFNRETNEEYILNFTNEATWNKMFRRSFVEDRELDFQGIRNGNDVYFVVNALCMAEKIAWIEEPLVNYRVNQENSLVGTLSKSALTPFQAWIDTAENLKENGIFPERSFVNKFCVAMFYLLRNIRTKEAFYETVTFLKESGFEKLNIVERDACYYHNKNHGDLVQHILNDTAEDFRDYLMFATYIELTEENAKVRLKNEEIEKHKRKIKKLEKELDDIKNCNSYKAGKIVTYVPRKIKKLIKILNTK